jgi:hypothetical protein
MMNDKTALQLLNEQQREDALRHRLQTLDETIAKANAAAERLVRCAESISNPVYSVGIQGMKGECQILAVRHFQGQISILVAPPGNQIEPLERKGITGNRIDTILLDDPLNV